MYVTILSGISGAGKDCYITSHFGDRKVTVVSADDYFMHEGQYRFYASDLGKAHAQCMRNFCYAVDRGVREIVVNNTNLTAIEIAPYYAVAMAYRYRVELVTIVRSAEVCAARNVHGVPLATCQRMAETLANREIPPYWEIDQCTR
jgi:predicted kinase